MDETLLQHILDEEKFLRDRLAVLGRIKARIMARATTRTPVIGVTGQPTEARENAQIVSQSVAVV